VAEEEIDRENKKKEEEIIGSLGRYLHFLTSLLDRVHGWKQKPRSDIWANF
jgi:hypothetical protein